jgi:hypothetical protein
VTRGIYLLANDRVVDHAIALAASIRARDPDSPLVLIPYDEQSERVAALLRRHFGVQPYPDPTVAERVARLARAAFGEGFFRRPNNFRKQACWFGPFDEFLYLDADVVVFSRIVELLDHLADHDFVCCDDQHRGGLTHVFDRRIVAEGPFSAAELADVFNAGLWGARRGLISEDDLAATFEEAARHRAWLDFAHGGSDQPVLNYLVLRRIPRRLNLLRRPEEPRMWAGTPGFRREGDLLVDPAVGRPLRYLHWAGRPIRPDGPYWDVWRHYRFLEPAAPAALAPLVRGQRPAPAPGRPASLPGRLLARLRRAWPR